jgi:hypothetical protein
MAMGTDKEDTDPSSPSALRPRVPDFAGTASAFDSEADADGGDKPTTDPGLGPAISSGTSPRSGSGSHRSSRRASVSVPPPSLRHSSASSAITPPDLTPIAAPLSAAPSAAKDSVELLLEGMAGPRPDRRKTMPQSDGEAAAAYHAEHGVRRARTSSEPGPKVVVERPQNTFPTERKRALAAPPVARVPAGLPGSKEALSTFVPARALRRRVALAVVAGLLIVLLSFMALRLTAKRPGALAPAPGTTTVAATAQAQGERPASVEPPSAATPEPAAGSPDSVMQEPSGPGAPQAAAVPVAPPTPIAPTTPPAPATPGSRATSPQRSGVGSGTLRHHHVATDHPADRPPGEAPSATGADLGEFKAKF